MRLQIVTNVKRMEARIIIKVIRFPPKRWWVYLGVDIKEFLDCVNTTLLGTLHLEFLS